MDPISGGVGIVLGVIKIYGLVSTAYDTCLDIKHLPQTYNDLRLGLVIEKQKFELWAASALSENEQQRVIQSPKDWALWKIFETVFTNMLEAFEECHQKMELVGQQTALPTQQNGLEGAFAAGSKCSS